MTRQWTREELDRVHPLPEGWMWELDGEPATWDATRTNYSDSVWVCDGVVDSISGEPPIDVVLAVILAGKGLDSREAMAAEVERVASQHVPAGRHEQAERWSMYGREALGRVAAMLRRGTVQP